MNTQPKVLVGRPHTFGWLRRSDCDRVVGAFYFEAWERPDSGMVRIPRDEPDRPIETIVAVRKAGFALVISPRGAVQAGSLSRTQV